MLAEGRLVEAIQVMQSMLDRLGNEPSYERAVSLARLGRYFEASGRPDLAATIQREGICVAERLEPRPEVSRLIGLLHTDLADVLSSIGQYAEAQNEYEAGLRIAEDLQDLRGQGVTLGQLGMLAMRQGRLDEALARHRAALTFFHRLGEPAMEAVGWHQLGMVLQNAEQLDAAERHYRVAARIKEEAGNLASAARTWNQLANISMLAGNPEKAEGWYRKAIDGGRAEGDLRSVSRVMTNLADLLQSQPTRLTEARQLAEEALSLNHQFDPTVSEIWKNYELLAEIADKEAALSTDIQQRAVLQAQARDHRRLAREAKRNFAGSRQEMRKHLRLVLATIRAARDSAHKENLDSVLLLYSDPTWNKLLNAVHRIVAGERDAEMLIEDLDHEESLIVETILAAVSDPSTLSDLLPGGPEA